MNPTIKTGIFLLLFFSLGLAVGTYEEHVHAGNTFSITAGALAGALQYLAAHWLHRSRV